MSNTHKSFARLLALLLAVCLLTAALAGCEDRPVADRKRVRRRGAVHRAAKSATRRLPSPPTTRRRPRTPRRCSTAATSATALTFTLPTLRRAAFCVVAVKSTLSGDTRTFAVQEILRAGEGESLYIPVNGFVLSLPEGMLPEGIRKRPRP